MKLDKDKTEKRSFFLKVKTSSTQKRLPCKSVYMGNEHRILQILILFAYSFKKSIEEHQIVHYNSSVAYQNSQLGGSIRRRFAIS
jgi:hypothetical protein